MTDPIKMLKDDHKKVRELFREYEAAGERAHAKKGKIAREIFAELDIHAAIEEEIFYPAAKERGKKDKELKQTVLEGEEEHHVMHVLVDELKAMDPQDERFDAKMTVLIESVEHHIKEEEKEVLPEAKEQLGEELPAIGEQMARRKEELTAQLGAAQGSRA
jgi:hemerythrin-like domain-containing protein